MSLKGAHGIVAFMMSDSLLYYYSHMHVSMRCIAHVVAWLLHLAISMGKSCWPIRELRNGRIVQTRMGMYDSTCLLIGVDRWTTAYRYI